MAASSFSSKQSKNHVETIVGQHIFPANKTVSSRLLTLFFLLLHIKAVGKYMLRDTERPTMNRKSSQGNQETVNKTKPKNLMGYLSYI